MGTAERLPADVFGRIDLKTASPGWCVGTVAASFLWTSRSAGDGVRSRRPSAHADRMIPRFLRSRSTHAYWCRSREGAGICASTSEQRRHVHVKPPSPCGSQNIASSFRTLNTFAARIATVICSHRLASAPYCRPAAFASVCRGRKIAFVTAGTMAEVPGFAYPARRLGTLDDVDLDGRRLVHPQHLVSVEVGLLDTAVLEGDLTMKRRGIFDLTHVMSCLSNPDS
jgi:hypothetical protein